MALLSDGSWVISCECGYCQADEHPRFNYLKKALRLACEDLESLYQADLGHRVGLAEQLEEEFIKEACKDYPS